MEEGPSRLVCSVSEENTVVNLKLVRVPSVVGGKKLGFSSVSCLFLTSFMP